MADIHHVQRQRRDEIASGTGGNIRGDELHDDSPKAKYEPVDPDAAAAAEWQQLYHAASPWVASHHHLITGSVLPVWNKIQEREGKFNEWQDEDKSRTPK